MLPAGVDGGDIQRAFFVILILGSIFGPLIERWARKKKQQKAEGEAETDADVAEVEIREEYPAEEPEPLYSLPEVSLVEMPPVDLRDIEVIEEPPRRPKPRPVVRRPAVEEVTYTRVTSEEYIPLDERVFKERELLPLARAIIYSEVFQPCRARRPFQRRI